MRVGIIISIIVMILSSCSGNRRKVVSGDGRPISGAKSNSSSHRGISDLDDVLQFSLGDVKCRGANSHHVVTQKDIVFEWSSLSESANFSHFNARLVINNLVKESTSKTLVEGVFNYTGKDGETVKLQIQAVGTTGEVSNWVETQPCIIDLSAPQPATSLMTRSDAEDDLDSRFDDDTELFFTWEKATDSPGSGILQYRVLVYGASGCSGSIIAQHTLEKNAFTYHGEIDMTYSFRVVAIDKGLHETPSDCSGSISIVPPLQPTILDLSSPTIAGLSGQPGYDVSEISITCDQDGYVGVFNNHNNKPLVSWKPIEAQVEEAIPISFEALQAASESEGLINLKVYCRSLVSTLSDPNTSQSILLDTVPPPALSTASAITGTSEEGDINLSIIYPQDTSDYDRVEVRRVVGTTAPLANCTDGDLIFTFESPFTNGSFVDSTGSTIGEVYSYRICVFDGAENKTSIAIASVRSRDTTPPPSLPSGLSGEAGSVAEGDIYLSWSYPADSSDYARVSIRRIQGTVAPDESCSDDDGSEEVLSLISPFTQTSYTDSTGSLIGDAFSYRACIFDRKGNLNSSGVITGVQARDTSSPLALEGFSAISGSLSGYIDISVNYPEDTSDYYAVIIRRLLGGSPPDENCETDGEVIYSDTSGPFTDTVVYDNTASTIGAAFSYRACIYDQSHNLTSSNVVVNTHAKDLAAPPDLDNFLVQTGTSAGQINIYIDFPEDVSDYYQVIVRRSEGALPPGDCTVGDIIRSYTTDQFNDAWPTADSGTSGNRYSYRVCIYDTSNNLNSVHVASNIMAYHGNWHDVDKNNCATYCTSLGKTNVFSLDGAKCASGESRPESAIAAGVNFRYGCWGLCTDPHLWGLTESSGSYCFGATQGKDYDATDFTIACYCQ